MTTLSLPITLVVALQIFKSVLNFVACLSHLPQGLSRRCDLIQAASEKPARFA